MVAHVGSSHSHGGRGRSSGHTPYQQSGHNLRTRTVTTSEEAKAVNLNDYDIVLYHSKKTGKMAVLKNTDDLLVDDGNGTVSYKKEFLTAMMMLQ